MVAKDMEQWKNENSANQIPAANAQKTSLAKTENSPEVAKSPGKIPTGIDFCGLDITNTDLEKLCKARYTVIAGENGCGKTRLLKVLNSYVNTMEPDAVAIFADFANAYFTFDEALVGEKNPSDEIVEILLDINSEFSTDDVSICEDFNALLASATKPFLRYLLSSITERTAKRNLKNVRKIFYEYYSDFFGLNFYEEARVTEILQEFEKNFSQKSPGQKMLCYFALLVSLAQVNGKKIYLLIDEPESHLHHERVSVFVNILHKLQKKSGQMKVLIATHSPYIVAKSAFSELIFLKNNQIQKKNHTYKLNVLESLLGESGEQLLYGIYTDAFCEFVAECLYPAEPEGEEKTAAYDGLRSVLNALPIGEFLDFGAGEGRLAANLDTISGREHFAKTKCVAYEYIDSAATDFKDKSERKRATLAPLYKDTLINEELDIYIKTDENKFSAVFMVNVLHEIPIKQWVETFNKIANALGKDGRLIFCETMILSMGEQENFIVMDEKAIMELFGVADGDVGFLKDKVIYANISGEQLSAVNCANLVEILTDMSGRYKAKCRETTKAAESRKKAFYACSYINIVNAIEDLKDLGSRS